MNNEPSLPYQAYFPEEIQAMLREGIDPHANLVERFLKDPSVRCSLEEKQAFIEQHYLITKALISPHSTQDIIAFATEILSLPDTLEGCIIEAGCYKGSSTAKFSIAAGLAGRQLVVFDSFQGLPAHNEKHGMSIEGREVIFQEGDFSGSLEEVRRNVATYGDIGACTFVPGWFEDTMKTCPSPVAAAYLDVDLLLSTRQCLAAIYPRLVPGGSIYSQDGHLPLILGLLEDRDFWETELGSACPYLEGIRKGKLVKITKPPYGD